MLVIIDAKPKEIGLPTEAYIAVEEVHDVSSRCSVAQLFLIKPFACNNIKHKNLYISYETLHLSTKIGHNRTSTEGC